MPDTPLPRAALLCPHCEEPTLANRLADGSLVCSCAAERPLPDPPEDVARTVTGLAGIARQL